MKKTLFFVIVLILSMGSTLAFASEKAVKASDTEVLAVPMSENKVLKEEIASMNERLGEIRDMEKSEMSAKDKKELKKELKKMKKGSGTIYIGGATLILLIILIAILV